MQTGLRQSINLPLAGGRVSLSNLTGGLVAGRSGAVNDGVLLFVGGSVSLTTWGIAAPDNDADEGTSVRIFRSGVYMVELGLMVSAGATVIAGISANQSAGFTGDPSFANVGTLDVLSATTPVGNVAPIYIKTPVYVAPGRAGDANSGGVVIRFLGSDGAGGAPAGIVQATAYYSITRVGTLYS